MEKCTLLYSWNIMMHISTRPQDMREVMNDMRVAAPGLNVISSNTLSTCAAARGFVAVEGAVPQKVQGCW
jgi:hypothetical protein